MKQKILDLIQQEITEDNKLNDFYPLTTKKVEWLSDFKKKVEAINFIDSYTMIKAKDAIDFQKFTQANYIKTERNTYINIQDREDCSLELVVKDYYYSKENPLNDL